MAMNNTPKIAIVLPVYKILLKLLSFCLFIIRQSI